MIIKYEWEGYAFFLLDCTLKKIYIALLLFCFLNVKTLELRLKGKETFPFTYTEIIILNFALG